ncbi:hypothetical protein V6N12_009162 [Hibiscus sabdariffa]|uniref:Uncharacterized protein n=1 Tax=Hibiscus sabdariffa TaxID=183260 RepID=A0ABR2C591_9ROSI
MRGEKQCKFFTEQLGTVDGHVENFSDDLLKQILGVELTNEMQDLLVAPVTPFSPPRISASSFLSVSLEILETSLSYCNN